MPALISHPLWADAVATPIRADTTIIKTLFIAYRF
jgi:hypothetical protein